MIFDGRFRGLHVLQLSGCKEFSKSFITNWSLDLIKSACFLKSLLDTIGNLVDLLELNVSNCVHLEEILNSVSQLTKLECRILKGCEALHTMCEFKTKMPVSPNSLSLIVRR